ncbi:MAG: orotate phosphoribosyltransferase-like protein [Archaeoglobi archaeon]|jgi:orotate phosphoribosyltransferase|nr:orotate phosphoribosyltransferase-like protein [Archaeoglobus sp.]TDA26781.1 MAG: orotate phosphoribosyltransferase-like protein [Archaeoglobi archaeon]
MKIESLVERARRLKEKGLTTEEIADELNVSFETAMWLLTRATETPPSDIYVEWKNLSKPSRLRLAALALSDMIMEKYSDVNVVVGIATSGIPLATMVAEELSCELAIYYPRRVREKEIVEGVLSENFADVDGKNCVIVDDVISTGRTISGAIKAISASNGKVLCVAVIANKGGRVDAPVLSLLRVTRI